MITLAGSRHSDNNQSFSAIAVITNDGVTALYSPETAALSERQVPFDRYRSAIGWESSYI